MDTKEEIVGVVVATKGGTAEVVVEVAVEEVAAVVEVAEMGTGVVLTQGNLFPVLIFSFLFFFLLFPSESVLCLNYFVEIVLYVIISMLLGRIKDLIRLYYVGS